MQRASALCCWLPQFPGRNVQPVADFGLREDVDRADLCHESRTVARAKQHQNIKKIYKKTTAFHSKYKVDCWELQQQDNRKMAIRKWRLRVHKSSPSVLFLKTDLCAHFRDSTTTKQELCVTLCHITNKDGKILSLGITKSDRKCFETKIAKHSEAHVALNLFSRHLQTNGTQETEAVGVDDTWADGGHCVHEGAQFRIRTTRKPDDPSINYQYHAHHWYLWEATKFTRP